MDKIWLQSYASGIPATIDSGGYLSLRDLIETNCKKFAENVAYTNMGAQITYAELDAMSRDFAAWLQHEAGLKKGDRIALMMPNIMQYPVALFGALRAGLVAVNVNPLYTKRELEHQMKDSGARAIVILENFAHTLSSVIERTELEHVITTQAGDMFGPLKRGLTNFVVKRVKKMVPEFSLPKAVKFRDVLSAGSKHALSHHDIGHGDLAFLQYTGGTTGVAKGAMLSHGNMVHNIQQSSAWLGDKLEEKPIIAITALPLYHIFSLEGNCLSILLHGGLNVLITNPRDMDGFVKEMSKYKFTYFTGVNTLFNGLLNTPSFSELDFSELSITIGGGMAVQQAVADRWKAVTGNPLIQAYGLTETSPAAVINPFIDDAEFTGSIGLPISSTEVAIVDDDGKQLAIGEIGEICIRGPQVMAGYWQRPEATDEVMLEGGWLRTGDIGRMNEKGFVFIEDRKKDMILVSGFNVYPNEIESVVVTLEGVVEAAAVGQEDEKSGEIVKLFVVVSSPAVTKEVIIAHCRENLTGYKVPKIIVFRDELPKTNVGKILRRELRDEK